MAASGELRRVREQMVEHQLRARDIDEPKVLEAMLSVERHRFVAADLIDRAYDDCALPIEHGQTISQPYVVAWMTQMVRAVDAERVLDVGTGSGYQAAVLAELVPEVHSIELVPELAASARKRLEALGYHNVHVHEGDGSLGWPDAAPYDAIIVACATEEVPPALIEQLAPGGRLALPVGDWPQEMRLIEKLPDGGTQESSIGGVAFVPMLHDAAER